MDIFDLFDALDCAIKDFEESMLALLRNLQTTKIMLVSNRSLQIRALSLT